MRVYQKEGPPHGHGMPEGTPGTARPADAGVDDLD